MALGYTSMLRRPDASSLYLRLVPYTSAKFLIDARSLLWLRGGGVSSIMPWPLNCERQRQSVGGGVVGSLDILHVPARPGTSRHVPSLHS